MEPVYGGDFCYTMYWWCRFQESGQWQKTVEAVEGILTQPVCESAVSCTVASVTTGQPSLYTPLNDKIKDNAVLYTCLKTLRSGDSLTKESGSYSFVP